MIIFTGYVSNDIASSLMAGDGDAEQVQDGALLEHGEELRACVCEHSASRESCCGLASDHRSSGDHPCMLQIPSDVHCRNGLCCSESTLQIKKIADNVFF